MGDYSKIAFEDAQEILQLYTDDKLQNLVAQSLGISNSNYQLELTCGSKLLLKICNDKNLEQYRNELSILNYLQSQEYQYAIAPLQLIASDQLHFTYGSYFGSIYPFVEGITPGPCDQTCYQIGSALGQLHTLTHDEQQFGKIRSYREVGFQAEDMAQYAQDHRCPEDFSNAFAKLIEPYLEDYYRLPREIGLIHGDLYYDNTLFKDNKINAVLDFEQSGVGPLNLDLGISISGSCLEKGLINRQLMKNFLSGYENFRPLSDHEKHWLDFSVILGLFSISLWRIKRFTEGSLNDQLKESYRELLKRAEDFKALC